MCEKLRQLLAELDLSELFDELNTAGIEFRHCDKLNERDIADAIKNVGRRVDFREKLYEWRSKKCGQESLLFRSFNGKTLTSILESSEKGKIMLEFYENNKKLSENIRHELTNSILEYVFH